MCNTEGLCNVHEWASSFSLRTEKSVEQSDYSPCLAGCGYPMIDCKIQADCPPQPATHQVL